MRNTGSLQYYYGYLGTGEYALTSAYKLAFGIDLRGYEGQHWREVRNLIGADYYVFTGDSNAATSVKRLGDRIAYHTDGLTRWGGGFIQIERQVNDFTAFLSTSASITAYKRIDYFRARVNGEWDQTDWKNFGGYTLKAGGNYNMTPTVNVYANIGWLSTAPKFGSVYHYDNSLYDPTFNEKVASFELGAGYLKRGVITGNANFYYTKWIDRSWPKSVYSAKLDQNFRFLLSGIDARHTGIEFDFKARAHPKLEVRSMVSLGNWEWLNDARAGTEIIDERTAIEIITGIQTAPLDETGGQIQRRHRSVVASESPHARTSDHQWNPHRRLQRRQLLPLVVIAEHLAMVAGKHNDCMVFACAHNIVSSLITQAQMVLKHIIVLLPQTRVRSYSRPATRHARDGAQTGDGQIALANQTPRSASCLRCGVCTGISGFISTHSGRY